MIENDLKELRLVSPAQSVRDRILAASRMARKDQRVGRWIRGVAALALAIAVVTVMFAPRAVPRQSSQASDPDHRPRFIRYLGQ